MVNTITTVKKSFCCRDCKAFWTAFFYCAGVLVIAGGAGIWVPAVIPGKAVGIDGVTTFVMATLAPIGADLIMKSEIHTKLSILWRASLFFFCLLAGALALIALLREKQGDEWITGWAAAFMSLIIWMTVVLKTEQFHSEPSISGSIGGEIATLNQLSGSGLSN